MDNQRTKVIFRKDKHDGEIVAFFPDSYFYGVLTCYEHLGQHGTATIEYYWTTERATAEEYKDLYNELTNIIGYDLKIMQRMTY